jgi:hypothetical protein
MKKWNNWNWVHGREINTDSTRLAEIFQSLIDISISLTSLPNISTISLQSIRPWTIFKLNNYPIKCRKVGWSSYGMGGYFE